MPEKGGDFKEREREFCARGFTQNWVKFYFYENPMKTSRERIMRFRLRFFAVATIGARILSYEIKKLYPLAFAGKRFWPVASVNGAIKRCVYFQQQRQH